MYERSYLTDKLLKVKDNGKVKVVFGVRRAGKSTLLMLYQKKLLQQGIDKGQILHINLDKLGPSGKTAGEILAEIEAKRDKERMAYIFLDEVQKVRNYIDLIMACHELPRTDLYLCGSSFDLFSMEVTKALAGKVSYIPVMGMSYREYCMEVCKEPASDKLLAAYRKACGFPHVIGLEDNARIRQEIEYIFIAILVQDFSVRKKHPDVYTMQNIIYFMLNYVGEFISIKELTAHYSENNKAISARTMANYINTLRDCFMIAYLEVFDLSHPERKALGGKYYIGDMAGYMFRDLDEKKPQVCMENIVLLELVRRGYRTYMGRIKGKIIDFYGKNAEGRRCFLQVIADADEKECKRKVEVLKLLGEEADCRLLSVKPKADSLMGIPWLSVKDWLMGET